MIVIVEGIDRVGKTTLVEMLKKVGFIDFKDSFTTQSANNEVFKDFSAGKLDTTIAFLRKMKKEGLNIVVDRMHLTEFVYGTVEGRGVNGPAIFEVDRCLANMGATLVYVRPTDLQMSSEKANTSLTRHNEYYEWVTKVTEMTVVRCTYKTLDEAMQTILNASFPYDIYFASPFFRDDQIEREERMISHLRSLGFSVFSPKENCNLSGDAAQSSRQAIFDDNCDAIRNSKMVFAVTDTKDMGTIWEAGYAFGIRRPVAYFAETLGDNQFNLMLAQSGRDVFTSQDQVTKEAIMNVLKGGSRYYAGNIE